MKCVSTLAPASTRAVAKFRSPGAPASLRQPGRASVKARAVATDLIAKCKDFMNSGGYYAPMSTETETELLSDDFVFRGSVFGPLNKQDYVSTIKQLKPYEGFPDIQHNSFGFTQDPEDPNRIWFFVKQTGTMTQDWTPFDKMTLRANGKATVSPTEAWNMIFSPDGKLKYISVGYCADRIMSNSPNGSTTTALVALFRTATGFEAPINGSPLTIGAIKLIEKFSDNRTTPYEELPAWFKQATKNAELYGPEGL